MAQPEVLRTPIVVTSKRLAAVAAEVVMRQQLNPAPKQKTAAPVECAGKRKSKGARRRQVVETGEVNVVVEVPKLAGNPAKTPNASIFR